MELVVTCVYCGVNRFVSLSDKCYTDVMAHTLVIPQSPAEFLRYHWWIETKSADNWWE